MIVPDERAKMEESEDRGVSAARAQAVAAAEKASDLARENASRRLEDAARTYDSQARKLAREASVPVDEAVGRYPWAAASATLILGLALGFVTGASTAALVSTMLSETRGREE